MNIRSANESDDEAVVALLASLHPEFQVAFSSSKVEQANRSFVAEVEGCVTGFALATYVRYGFTSYGMLDELIVHQDYRGKGIGKALVEACLHWMHEYNVEVTFVSAGDADAVSFYEKQRFKRCIGPWLYALPW